MLSGQSNICICLFFIGLRRKRYLFAKSIDKFDRQDQRIRVLLIVDSLYWAIGNFAQQIIKESSWIDPFICSQFTIRQYVKRFGSFPMTFDVVHFLTMRTMPPFSGRLPIVTTLHHIDSSTDMAHLDYSDAVMTVSEQWQQHLRELGVPKERLRLVPFGVDINQFRPANVKEYDQIREDFQIASDAFVIGFSARRTSDTDGRKGVQCFVQAVRTIRRILPNLSILIIGPGWQGLVRELNNDGIHCVQVGYQLDHMKIAKLYRILDVFWVTSRIEGGPVPLLEAMASGISCISTPVGAAVDLVEHQKNGFLVPFDCPDQLVQQTLQLADNQVLRERIGCEARSTIVRKRQWGQVIQHLKPLYEGAIKNFYQRETSKFLRDVRLYYFNEATNSTSPQLLKLTNAFSPKSQNWIQACEHLRGLKMMMQLGEWRIATQVVGLALKVGVTDHNVWWQLVVVLVNGWKKKLWPRKAKVLRRAKIEVI